MLKINHLWIPWTQLFTPEFSRSLKWTVFGGYILIFWNVHFQLNAKGLETPSTNDHFNPYWQIMETKSKNWEITHRVSRKQNPEKFQKSWFGNVTGCDLRKQNPGENTEYLVIIFFFEILGMSPSVFHGNKIQTIISGDGINLKEYY